MSQPSAEQGRAPYTRRLKNYLLDAPLQLKFAGYFMALTLGVAVVLGGFLVRTTDSLYEQVNSAVQSRSKAAEASRELGTCSLNNELAKSIDDPEFAKTLEARSKAIDASYEGEVAAVQQQRTELVAEQKRTLWVLSSLLAAFILMVGFAAIVMTHRIVGPLFRIKRMAREVADGKVRPPAYGLRPGDELRDVFEVFVAMIRDLRTRTQADLAQVDAALGGDPAALAALKKELETRLARE